MNLFYSGEFGEFVTLFIDVTFVALCFAGALHTLPLFARAAAPYIGISSIGSLGYIYEGKPSRQRDTPGAKLTILLTFVDGIANFYCQVKLTKLLTPYIPFLG